MKSVDSNRDVDSAPGCSSWSDSSTSQSRVLREVQSNSIRELNMNSRDIKKIYKNELS